jgi:hypothetical protein
MTGAGTAHELPLFTVPGKDADVSNQNLQAEATLVGFAQDGAPYRPAVSPV